MKVHSGIFFETKVCYEKMNDDGTMKRVAENYVVDAISFTECEKRITEEMLSYISGEFEVVGEKIVNYSQVISSDESTTDLWYKLRILFESLDQKTDKVKKTYANYLVQAKSDSDAIKSIGEYLDGMMVDWKIYSMTETNILDVFFYEKKSDKK